MLFALVLTSSARWYLILLLFLHVSTLTSTQVGFSSFDPADPAFDSALQRFAPSFLSYWRLRLGLSFGALFDQLTLTLETHSAHEDNVCRSSFAVITLVEAVL
jgi:hypothetical protein